MPRRRISIAEALRAPRPNPNEDVPKLVVAYDTIWSLPDFVSRFLHEEQAAHAHPGQEPGAEEHQC